MKSVFILFLLSHNVFGQIVRQYLVSANTLNMREKVGDNSKINHKLRKSDIVRILDYSKSNPHSWYVYSEENTSFGHSGFLTIDPLNDWRNIYYETGVSPECENIKPEIGEDYNGELTIDLGVGLDVVLKLTKINANKDDDCIGIMYILEATNFQIKNISEGKYYLKLGYGHHLTRKIENDKCKIRYKTNVIYKKGVNILGFNRIDLPDEVFGGQIKKRRQITPYKLILNSKSGIDESDILSTSYISEDEFNI